MTVRDTFGLMVRGVGLVLILFGLLDLISLLLHLAGLSTRPDVKTSQLAAAVAAYFVTSAMVIGAADLVTRLIYGRRRNSN